MKCFETIKVLNGEIFHLEYHNYRFNQTRKEIFKVDRELNLNDYISPPKEGLYRCKVIYSKEVENIEFFPYIEKKFQNFQIVNIVNIDFDYSYKFLNREVIDNAKSNFDEIIMVKDELVLDTSIANIAIYNGSWLTPKTPLLKGTTRKRLIESGFLKEANLTIKNLLNAEKFAIMNAMVDFKEIDLWRVSH